MSDDRKADETVGRSIRIDLIIAVCALLVSGLATAANWWQTRVIAQQLSAQVWPYVTLTASTQPDQLELDVQNDGLGPAVIKSFVVAVDGRPQHDLIAALRLLVGHIRNKPQTHLLLSGIEPGEVLRPSSSQPLIRLHGDEKLVATVAQQAARVTIEVCYCSILATCWTLSYPGGEPAALPRCVDRRAEELHDPPLSSSAGAGF